MKTNLQVGDKVVCVKEDFTRHPKAHLFSKMPKRGWIYCVKELATAADDDQPLIDLVGIKCRRDEDGSECGFNLQLFPPDTAHIGKGKP